MRAVKKVNWPIYIQELKKRGQITMLLTQGFLGSLFQLLKLMIQVPDYTTVTRRLKTQEPIHIVLDSTGLKIYGGRVESLLTWILQSELLSVCRREEVKLE